MPYSNGHHAVHDFMLVINTNLHPIYHRFQVIADYWSNLRFRQAVHLFNAVSKLRDTKIGLNRSIVRCRIDILNCFSVDHECDRQTDKQNHR